MMLIASLIEFSIAKTRMWQEHKTHLPKFDRPTLRVICFRWAPPLGCWHDEQPLSFQCCSLDTYFLWCHHSLCRSGRDADPQRRPLASTLGQNVLLVDHHRCGDCGGDVAHPIRFVFLLVALFSFYLAFSGYRVLSRKTPQQRPSNADWTAASTMLLGGLVLVAYGV
jgi:hypothetical protein